MGGNLAFTRRTPCIVGSWNDHQVSATKIIPRLHVSYVSTDLWVSLMKHSRQDQSYHVFPLAFSCPLLSVEHRPSLTAPLEASRTKQR